MKIHPHIKHYIRSVLMSGSSLKTDKWKDAVVKEIEEELFSKLTSTISTESYQETVDQVIKEFEEQQMKQFLLQMKQAFKQIPLSLIKDQ